MQTTPEKITRNSYGEIIAARPVSTFNPATYGFTSDFPGDATATPAAYGRAWDIIATAAHQGKLTAAFDNITWDRKRRADGEACHHELYDCAPGAALICQRYTEGTRYGVKTTSKTYYLLTRTAGKITCTIAPDQARIAKLGKSGLPYGGIIAAITGKKPATIKTKIIPAEIGYKALVKTAEGKLVSAWDDSEWQLGRERAEKLDDNEYEHPKTGLYYYKTLPELINAATNNEIFGEARSHKNLIVVEVQVRGRRTQVTRTKRAATYIKPLREIAAII